MDRLLEDLKNSFEELGITVDESALTKCVEICKGNNVLSAEEFVDAWMAYSLSKLHGENPTIPQLIKFERDEYGKKNKDSQYENVIETNSLHIYEAKDVEMSSLDKQRVKSDFIHSILRQVQDEMMPYSELESTDITSVYDDSTSKGDKTGSHPQTPEGNHRMRNKSNHQVLFSPASFSPSITCSSSKYNSRTSSGDVVFPYKNEGFTSSGGIVDGSLAKIDCLNSVEIERFMNFDLVDALDYVERTMAKIGSALLKKYELEDPLPVRLKHPSPFVTIGRIVCDSEGRLNSKSILLEGSRELSLGEVVPLDLEDIEKYSVFPGQVVAVEGVNVSGEKFTAKKIFYDASPEFPLSKPRGLLNITVAAGPFTQTDSMAYEPLIDLIQLTRSDEPDFLILIGPFIDSTHPIVLENSLAETHRDLFEKIIGLIMTPLQGKKTQVIMASSYKDCNAFCVYPTPRICLNKNYKNLHLLPDPSLFEINGTVIGVTSVDILMHIGKEELSSPGYTTDRLTRLANHVLSQRSFYPLAPPAGVPIDPSRREATRLDIKPHILILPSDFRYFIKEVSGCIVVNPERLAKGLIGGTYARLNLDASGFMGNIIRI